jgi:hypothetical protein
MTLQVRLRSMAVRSSIGIILNSSLPALLYRLGILHFASSILPSIGADTWEFEDGVDNFWDNRPVRAFSRFHVG